MIVGKRGGCQGSRLELFHPVCYKYHDGNGPDLRLPSPGTTRAPRALVSPKINHFYSNHRWISCCPVDSIFASRAFRQVGFLETELVAESSPECNRYVFVSSIIRRIHIPKNHVSLMLLHRFDASVLRMHKRSSPPILRTKPKYRPMPRAESLRQYYFALFAQ